MGIVHPSPSTSASFNPAASPNGIYPDPVTVSLSATAASGFAVEATYYRLDGGSEQLYTEPFIISGMGMHTLEYWSIDDAGVYETPKTKTILIQELFPDLTFGAAGLSFSDDNPESSETVTIDALVTNQGYLEASDVKVKVFDFDTLVGETTIANLNPGESANVSILTTFPEEGFRLVTARVDPADAIPELDETNNQTSQILIVGQPDPSDATIFLQAFAITTCRGELRSINGSAYYVFAEVTGHQDHPVQGGQVTVKLLDSTASNVLAVYTGSHTNVNGDFSQSILAPGEDGTYPVLVEITDKTITVVIQISLTVSGPCVEPTPPPPPPPSPSPGPTPPNTPPTVVQDLYVFSEDIFFSVENPDEDETITILANVHYYGTDPVYDIPVTINDIFPVDGVLQTFPIGTASVSFPNGGGSLVAITLPWTNNAEGAHIIQVVLEPDFPQNTQNDKATRLIFVGEPVELDFTKNVTLAIDADGNGLYSPGDTLSYTIAYANLSDSDVTGVVLVDDFDEGLVDPPFQISNAGSLSNGTITWSLGTLAAGASGSVTYQVSVKSQADFPSGVDTIQNIAVLTTDQTPPVAASAEIEVVVNRPPTAIPGEGYSAYEGGAVNLHGEGTDPDNDPLTYAWDLDNDGVFEAPGQDVFYSAVGRDGPDSQVVDLQVCDPFDECDTASTTVEITNANPIINSVTNDGPIDEGSSATIAVTASDPAGSADPLSYQFDCDNDIVFEIGPQSTASASCRFLDNGDFPVNVRVTDDDGGEATGTTTVDINNLPPVVGPIAGPDEPLQVNTSFDVSANFTDPGVLDTHTAEWDWGDDSTSVGTIDEANGSGTVIGSHSYTQPGVYTIVLTVMDDDGDTGQSVCQFAVVYDPEGSFVTGGGWVESPQGAYTPDPYLTGKATFGFVAKYKKGANTPTGQTEFQFVVADLNFHSTSYDWLVVAGAKAQFKGTGTINGEGEYGFMLTATDGQLNGGDGVDKFRIKIWDKATDQVIYDNQLGAAEDADPATELGGGSVVIHSGK